MGVLNIQIYTHGKSFIFSTQIFNDLCKNDNVLEKYSILILTILYSFNTYQMCCAKKVGRTNKNGIPVNLILFSK